MNEDSKRLVCALIEQVTNAVGLEAGYFKNDPEEPVKEGTLRILSDTNEKWFVRIEGYSERQVGRLETVRLEVYGLLYNPVTNQAEALGVCSSNLPATARYNGVLRQDNLAETVELLTNSVIPEIRRVALETKANWQKTAEAQETRRALAAWYGINPGVCRAPLRISDAYAGELTLDNYAEDATRALGLRLSGLNTEQVDAILAILNATVAGRPA